MLLAVILVCSLGTSPADCTRETALDVATRPAPTPMACAMTGQIVGASQLDVRAEDGRYLKTICERRRS